MSGNAWAWARAVAASATLAVVVWYLGVGPFLDGVRAVDGAALAAGAGIGLLTTVCCAWRWTIVARGLSLHLSLPAAVAAYYRSVFLNLALPGGIAGDVHRGVSHGRNVRDVGLALRAVAWERTAGQVVQAVVTLAVLVALPSPVRPAIPLVLGALVAAMIVVVLVGRERPGDAGSRWARLRRAIARDLRGALLARKAWPAIAFASVLVVVGHAITFVIAARTAGVTAPLRQLLPLAVLAMLAMVLPSVAGWGPREGTTAWAFAASGLGAEQGVATAVVYGVMVLAANLPGALLLVTAWAPRTAVVQTDGTADA
ncbi:MAG TPA: lysylphosphatidylglycerol synthase transmembrane domain-containing protein [Gaiellaceae bacterium]|nr:lysylphosphatidylglycerol synthase transmembrane domain-containing protein [Gaiellaceae bacterium]